MGVNAAWLAEEKGPMLPAVSNKPTAIGEPQPNYDAAPVEKVEHLLDAIESVLAVANIRPDFFGKRTNLAKTLLKELGAESFVKNSTGNNQDLKNDSSRQSLGAAGEELSKRIRRPGRKKDAVDGKSTGSE